jgi:hypothetical protein
MNSPLSALKQRTSPEYEHLLEQFGALKEQYALLWDQYEGWKQSVLPDSLPLQLREQLSWERQRLQRQLHQFHNHLVAYQKSLATERALWTTHRAKT